MIHHDLQLFRRFKKLRGVGPRILWNETPEAYRHAGAANGGNIFYLDLKMEPALLQEIACNALSMPWTAQPPLSRNTVAKTHALLDRHYSKGTLQEFDTCERLNRWSPLDRLTFHSGNQIKKLRKIYGGAP